MATSYLIWIFTLITGYNFLYQLKPKSEIRCVQHRRYPVLHDCYKYGYCLNDKILILNCPQKHMFDKNNNICQPMSENITESCYQKRHDVCYEDSVLCHDTLSCVAPSDICNGILDCLDGSDEKLDCNSNKSLITETFSNTTQCEFNEFKCVSEGCIPQTGRCNGLVECIDMSDELECVYNPVAIGEEDRHRRLTNDTVGLKDKLTIGFGKKQPIANLEANCPRDINGECINPKSLNCSYGLWACDSMNECVPRESYCDGIAHCHDLSDELNCREENPESCDPEECIPPHCRCPSADLPPNVALNEMPQIILITFDDSVRDQDFKNIYKRIFQKSRLNPNGCPISATFFVSNEYTDYSRVNQLYRAGHEISSHTISHRVPESFWNVATFDEWRREVAGQRDLAHKLGNIPKEDIVGMRAPYLRMGGNTMFEMLQHENFTYDSSWVVQEITPPFFPFTLDYPLDLKCLIDVCPNKSFSKIWEVPLLYFQTPIRTKDGSEDDPFAKSSGKLVGKKRRKRLAKRASYKQNGAVRLSPDITQAITDPETDGDQHTSKLESNVGNTLDVGGNGRRSNVGDTSFLISPNNNDADNGGLSPKYSICAMIDGCPLPSTVEGAFSDMKLNFERHYLSNKAPLPLFFHSSYFQSKHTVAGFTKFLDYALSHDDVWIVTISKMLEWMKKGGVPKTKLSKFGPFGCDEILNRQNFTCNRPRVCKYQIKRPTWTEEKYVKQCPKRCSRAYPSINSFYRI